jgi:ribosomal protein L29
MKELKKQDSKDLKKLLGEKREELRTLRFGTAGSATRDVRVTRRTRKEVAAILTELNARKEKETA